MLESPRRLLLVILVLALVGTGTELLLLGHYETPVQSLPLGMVAIALAALAWREAGGTAMARRIFAIAMVALCLVGLAGLFFHFRGNMAFEVEMHPAMKRLPLVWESLRGATPALAPAIMVYTGLLGLAYHLFHRKTLES